VPLRTYVSPLGRAKETADIVAQHILIERIEEPRLKEVSVGSWDGLTQYEIRMAVENPPQPHTARRSRGAPN
jgi:broad specificity phosphatase PhoE